MEYKRAKFRELIKTVGLEEKDYPGGAFEFVEIVESEMVWNLYISFSAVIGIDALKRLEERLIARFKTTISRRFRYITDSETKLSNPRFFKITTIIFSPPAV